MKQIKLVNQELFALVDDADYPKLIRYSWYIGRSTTTLYARTRINGKVIGMHRLICPSTDPKLTPDHINRDGLDNRRENLRLATKSQQAHNQHKPKSASKYHGVSWNKQQNCWTAYIRYKQLKHLGVFDNEEAAARAFNVAAIKYFGEFANLNAIQG